MSAEPQKHWQPSWLQYRREAGILDRTVSQLTYGQGGMTMVA